MKTKCNKSRENLQVKVCKKVLFRPKVASISVIPGALLESREILEHKNTTAQFVHPVNFLQDIRVSSFK